MTRRVQQIRAEDSTEQTVSSEPIATLRSNERLTYRCPWRGGQMRERTVLNVATSDGLIGGAQCHGKGDLDQLRHILQGVNLCDHQRVWQAVESAEGDLESLLATCDGGVSIALRTKDLPSENRKCMPPTGSRQDMPRHEHKCPKRLWVVCSEGTIV